MAYSRERTKKDGRVFYEIRAYNVEKKQYYTKYYYPPDGWSAKAIKKQLQTETEAFQVAVDNGEVLSKAELKEAQAEAEAAKAALRTVKDYAKNVWMAEKELTLAETTRASYQSTLDLHIYPVIGDMLLVDVTTPILRKLILDYQKSGKSLSSSRTLYVVLNQLFDSAFKDDLIPISPMLKIDRPKAQKDAPIINEADKSLDESQVNYILACVDSEPLKWKVYINLSIDTGCRRGELVALRWSDIDFKANTVTIRKNAQYTPEKGVYITTPKSGKERVVDIGQTTVDLLSSLKEEQTAKLKEAAEKSGEKVVKLCQWVFTQDGTTEMMFPDSPTRYFKNFSERYNVNNFHPHILRHTSASIAIRNGADIASVSRRLGHSSIEITMRTYVHATEDGIRNAGQSVRDALEKQKKADEAKTASAEK